MNEIGVIKGKSEYSDNDHLMITIDGRQLDHLMYERNDTTVYNFTFDYN